MTQKKPQWAVIIRQGRTERILFSLLPARMLLQKHKSIELRDKNI